MLELDLINDKVNWRTGMHIDKVALKEWGFYDMK